MLLLEQCQQNWVSNDIQTSDTGKAEIYARPLAKYGKFRVFILKYQGHLCLFMGSSVLSAGLYDIFICD